MAHQGVPKMSLVSQFDDLCRYTKILTSGPEEEFKVFVESQLKCVRKWKKTEFEAKKLLEKISNLQSENGRLDTKIKHLKDLLQDADSTRRKIESEKNSLARQIAIIKEVLLADGVMDNQTKEKLVFLSSTYKPNMNSPTHLHTIEESAGSILSLSDIDQTDDDLENRRRSSKHRSRRSKEKRSNSETRISQKKTRYDEAEEFVNRVSGITNVPFIDEEQRSNSEPTSSSPDIPAVYGQRHKSDSAQFKVNTYDLKFDTGTPVSQPGTIKHISKNHQFVSKTVMNRVKCLPCRQNVGYLKQSLKCQVCGIICHPECIKQCPMLCFPIVNTPTKGTKGTVADYTSSTHPKIPPLIVHCVREIESRGLKDIGLYRVSASERDVKSLKEKFVVGRTIPCLSDVDIHALCGTVKEFLRSLKEPLVTHKAWQAFVDAANLSDETESSYALYGIVMGLPQANRDTLSFLILHLQKVAESAHCKMDIENLARVFGPTIVGYSTLYPADSKMLKDTPCQYQVMKRLLSIPSDSWQNMLSVDSDVFQGSIKETPENLPAPRETRLGPIYTSVQKRRSVNLRRTPLTPRNSRTNKPGRMHFASPLLK